MRGSFFMFYFVFIFYFFIIVLLMSPDLQPEGVRALLLCIINNYNYMIEATSTSGMGCFTRGNLLF
jgi:hypothetical protein